MMSQRKTERNRKKRGDTRFPGICRRARVLGVNRCTLYRMLIGADGWDLPALRVRYEQLVLSERGAA
jgi:hypothetical protein